MKIMYISIYFGFKSGLALALSLIDRVPRNKNYKFWIINRTKSSYIFVNILCVPRVGISLIYSKAKKFCKFCYKNLYIARFKNERRNKDKIQYIIPMCVFYFRHILHGIMVIKLYVLCPESASFFIYFILDYYKILASIHIKSLNISQVFLS